MARKGPKRKKLCKVCRWRPARANGRCHTDDAYFKRNGRDRTEEQIVAHAERVMDRQYAVA